MGAARDLGTIENRHWFGLRQGGHPKRSLQEAWREHGEASFRFERVEVLKDDLKDYERDQALKERLAFWKAELKAETL